MKKRVVTMAMAAPSVEAGAAVVPAGETFELVMGIESGTSRYSLCIGMARQPALCNSLLYDDNCSDAFPVDLRTTNSGSINISVTKSSLFLIWFSTDRAAISPIFSRGCRTVVSGGLL